MPVRGRRALKSVAAAYDRLRPPPRGVTVLIYHRVGARTPVSVDLPTALFDEQMAELASSGRAVTLDAALDVLARPDVPDLDPIVVTFDDGTADFVDEAVPVLVRHGIPALLYVATRFVDEGLDFPDEGRPASWAGLRDAVSTGLVEIGSHTHGHALLDRIDAAAVPDELDRSVDLIAEHVGRPPVHFAYPKALPGSPSAAAEVARRFRSASLAGTRPNPYGRTDPHRLARSPIQVGDQMRWFRRKAAGGMAMEDTLRRTVNRVRHAGASH